MSGDNGLKEVLEESLRLYREMLGMTEVLSDNLSSWSDEHILDHAGKARNLQSEVQRVDTEIERISQQQSHSHACQELQRQRTEIMKLLLSHHRENIPVIERMMAVVHAEIVHGKAFRHAAGGYFGGGKAKGKMLTRIA